MATLQERVRRALRTPTPDEPTVATTPQTAGPAVDEVVAAIAKAANISHDRALDFVTWVGSIVQHMRDANYDSPSYLLSEAELDEFHATLAVIAPDKAVAEPGTPHALLEDLVLDRTAGEVGLVHDKTREGRVQYCVVDVVLTVVK